MKTVDSFDFLNKKALVRVDFNVPLNERNEITDDTRITATIPTIKKILNDGGSCILMSHLGRPKDGPTEKYSLRHLVAPLSLILGLPVKFADDCIGKSATDLAQSLKSGEVLLLENLRFYKEEEKGDVAFSEKLAKLGDVWVNDWSCWLAQAASPKAMIMNDARRIVWLMDNAPEYPSDKLLSYGDNVEKHRYCLAATTGCGCCSSVSATRGKPVLGSTAICTGSRLAEPK